MSDRPPIGCDYDPTDEIVYTRGVSSQVYDEDESEIGHCTLLDLDGSDSLSVQLAAGEMDGYVAVFRSSEGSYHLWQLTVRDWEECVLDSLLLSLADAEHIKQSQRRGRFVLRSAPKKYEDGGIYKHAPELLEVYDSGEGKVSAAHYWLVRQYADRDGVAVPAVEESRLIGDDNQCEIHTYMTVSDAAKEMIQ